MPFGILSLLLDQMTVGLGLPLSQNGIFFGTAGIGAAAGWFGGGWLLRHFKRPIVFKMLLLGEAVALLIAALSPYWVLTVAAFFVIGFCQCGGLSAALSVAADLNPGKSAGNISLIMSANLLIPIFVWGTGYLLDYGIGWRGVLGLVALPLVFSTIWMSFLRLPEHEDSADDENGGLAKWGDIVEFPLKFVFPNLMVIASFTITIGIYGWAGILGERILGGIDNAALAAGVMLFGVGLGPLMIGSVLRNHSPGQLIIGASFLLVILNALLLLEFTGFLIWGLFLFLGVMGGAVQPLSISLAEKEMGRTSHRSIATIGLWGEGGGAMIYYLIGYLSAFFGGFVRSFATLMVIASVLLLVSSLKIVMRKRDACVGR